MSDFELTKEILLEQLDAANRRASEFEYKYNEIALREAINDIGKKEKESRPKKMLELLNGELKHVSERVLIRVGGYEWYSGNKAKALLLWEEAYNKTDKAIVELIRGADLYDINNNQGPKEKLQRELEYYCKQKMNIWSLINLALDEELQ